MKTIMNTNQLQTIEQLTQFLDGTQSITLSIEGSKKSRYAWIRKTLVQFHYLALAKPEKGIVKQYVMKIIGCSRAQLTRLIHQYQRTGKIILRHNKNANRFKTRYTRMDILLLAQVDELHGTLSGYATKKLCERAYIVFEQKAYQRLAFISVAHIYNLRHSTAYKRQRWQYEKTKQKPSEIGIRRKPMPNGEPGYIRIDTVHQGDLDKQKGVYHINAVDEVTQFEVVCSVEKISEHYLIPVLEAILNTFPFLIKGFHSDNGSEYVNQYVVKLLDKLLIEFTKSRPRHSNDNALAECKNGAIVRKTLGYMHIPQEYAEQVNAFNRDYLNPYVNFHRPCLFAEIKIDAKGKQRKTYPYKLIMTPYEKFKSLPDAAGYLKSGLTFVELDRVAMQMTDNEAAKQMQEARSRLFQVIQQLVV
jgi:transposase InsO family protein